MSERPAAVTLMVSFDPMRLSPNTRLDWRERARRTRRAHESATIAWRQAGSPVVEGPVEVRLLIRRGRRMDPDNGLASCKAILDALLCRDRRGTGVVADDSSQHVCYRTVAFETGSAWRGREQVVVTISPAADEQEA